jgi:uncharacterized membrane protein
MNSKTNTQFKYQVSIFMLLICIIPFLTNIYVIKYLHDVKGNKHCKEIGSYSLSFYYDYYFVSAIILGISILGALLALYKYTHIFKGNTKGALKLLTTANDKYISILSLIFGAGLVKLVYDLRVDPGCEKIDQGMATSIYYYGILGLVVAVFNLFKG